jgi:hypothetical protein
MKNYFIPVRVACPIVDTSLVIQGAIDYAIEQQVRDLLDALDEEALRFEAAGNVEMAAKLREWKEGLARIWGGEPDEPDEELAKE